ncbi:MAG: OmpH family outer membrane protein [Dysgonamonadaceae bacterium]|jgi:outer membrane protein|nr:OmpH family outer membrane protein [Dysgonamonadaceae bacterium]
MFKKLLLFALLALPVGVFAQEIKIAYVNTQEIFNNMPETSAMEIAIANLNQTYTNELKAMEDEYKKKYSEFIEQADSLPESIKVRRMQEVQDLQQKTETFYQHARQEVQKKQQELLAPIQKKITDAIKLIGEENDFTYVLEEGAFLYVSAKSINATQLVKTKLGLK